MSRSILLVDDDINVSNTLAAFFKRRGWTVSRAEDSVEGLQAYERERPEVVLLDVRMPGISGLDVLQVLMRRDPDATVIMLTGHGDGEMSEEAMRLGAENFITKPVSFDHLEIATDRALDKSRVRRQARARDGQ